MLGTLEPVSLGFGVVLVSTEEKLRQEKLRMATHPSKSRRQMRTQVETQLKEKTKANNQQQQQQQQKKSVKTDPMQRGLMAEKG